MSIATYLKKIGRGKDGARSLDRPQARDLMSQVLDARVTDLEVGAFVMAMRIKGESTSELAGFLDAVQERCVTLNPPAPMVALPSYNGARRLPNLTALLALLLAKSGIPVLVHGPATEPGRVTTIEIFHALGLPGAHDVAGISNAWASHHPVAVTTDVLCPSLARLLDTRRVIGVRNSGHTVAKLIAPAGNGHALRVCNYTHPEYGLALTAFLQHTAANAMLLRGTEGEPVADARRLPRLDVFIRGALKAELSLAAREGPLTTLPFLPGSIDAAATAAYIECVVKGEQEAPAPLLQQLDCLRRALHAMGDAALAHTTAA